MGFTLLVNHGATLPKVDLESGISTGELKNVELRHRKKVLNFNGLIAAPIFLIPVSEEILPYWGKWILIFTPSIIMGTMGYFRRSRKPSAPPPQEIIIVREFVTPQRLSKQALKKNITRGVLITAVGSFIGVLVMYYATPQPNFRLIAGLFSFAGLAVLGVNLWGFMPRPKGKVSDGVGDSIVISPIHPNAFEFLRQTLERQNHPIAETNPHRPYPQPASQSRH